MIYIFRIFHCNDHLVVFEKQINVEMIIVLSQMFYLYFNSYKKRVTTLKTSKNGILMQKCHVGCFCNMHFLTFLLLILVMRYFQHIEMIYSHFKVIVLILNILFTIYFNKKCQKREFRDFH